ncbi:MAG TPA: AI-2E family transporter [Candidatus Saccharimonadales bacterium]|nr:AI-2E family transporter [Candidatus Saccharimonadales bacterium]
MFDFRRNHILQALVVIAVVWLLIKLSAIVLLFFIAFLLVTVLRPLVDWLERHHVPVALAVFLPILGVAVLAALVGYFVVPNIIAQGSHFAQNVPDYTHKLQRVHGFDFHFDVGSLRQSLQGHFGTVGNTLVLVTRTAIELVVGVITIIVVTLYWLGSYDRVQQTMLSYVPAASRRRAADIWARAEKKLVSWLVAQVLLGLIVGLMVWIGAIIIGLPFAGVLGMISGLLEIIPTLGPIAAAVPGILLGFTVSWKTAVAALIMYLAVQQVENHLLAPFLVGRTVRLHPIIIILSLLIGAALYGIGGALLAVPIALVISSFVDSFRDGKPRLEPRSYGGNEAVALPFTKNKSRRRS